MAEIEILAYCPVNMTQFINFCVEGKRDASGAFETDDQGRAIVGVFNWLYGGEVPEAHFFTTAPTDSLQLFVAQVERTGTETIPWMGRIPAIEQMIKIDGLFGTTSSFTSIENLLALVKPNTFLDQKFKDGQTIVARLLASLEQGTGDVSVTREEFLATLQGSTGGNQALLAELASSFTVSQ